MFYADTFLKGEDYWGGILYTKLPFIWLSTVYSLVKKKVKNIQLPSTDDTSTC
jgi:hypothetical protein